MALKGEHRVVANHAAAIIGNLQETAPASLNVDHDPERTGVDCVLNQFFCH